MGFKNSINTIHGIEINEAYFRINHIYGDKNKMNIILDCYSSQTACTEGKTAIEQRTYNFVPSVIDGSENFIKQGYEHLKTLEEYKNAIDC